MLGTLCLRCGEHPRLGALSRCKKCLQQDANAACPPKKAAQKGRTRKAKAKLHRCCRCRRKKRRERMATRPNGRLRLICKLCEAKAANQPKTTKRRSLKRLSKEERQRRLRQQWSTQVARYRERYPERHAARERLRQAIRNGKVQRPEICQAIRCQRPADQGHHNDYREPLKPVFLCRYHHETAHHEASVPLKPGAPFRFAMAP